MIIEDRINGHRVLRLESDILKIAILPDKGADIYAFVHNPSGVGFLLETPAGLMPPGEQPPSTFLENYEGAWQELFPSTGAGCNVQSEEIPMHGEVALLPWKVVVEREDEDEISVRFSIRCRRTPFRLERLMRLRRGISALEIEGRVTNEGNAAAPYVWGHHVVLGGTFLESGCQIKIPARTLHTPDASRQDETARLAPDQQTSWPVARGRLSDEPIDLSYVPGPEVRSRDDAFLTDLTEGRIAVTNPRLGLQFALDWDVAVFSTVVLWQAYGADSETLGGTYGLGIEPWVSRYNLEQAIRHGEALTLEPGQSMSTSMVASVHPWSAS